MFTLLVAVAGVTPAEPPAFVATRVGSGEPVTGAVAKIGPGFSVGFAGKTPPVAAEDLVSLARSDAPRPPYPIGPQVILANGDRIAGTVAGGSALSVSVKSTFGNGQSVSLPLTAVLAIWIASPPVETLPEVARYPWLESRKKQDVLLLRNGDVLRGRLEAVAADGSGVRFKPDGEKAAKPFDLTAVAAIALDPTLARVKTPKGPYARVTTADGSRIGFATLLADERVVTGTTVTGAKLSLPLTELIAVDVRGGKAVELGDLAPSAVEERSYNGVPWPWVANRSVRGNPLRLTTPRGVELFDAGLGMHSKSTLTFPLGGKYKRFEALVGLDAATGRKGAVDIRLLVDGKEAVLDGLTGLTASAGSKAVRLDVTNAKQLTLVVDFGPGGDVQDDVNWVNARLVE